MSNPRLSQVVAARTHKQKGLMADLIRSANLFKKQELFAGLERRYVPKDDEGERKPSESQRVRHTVSELLEEMVSSGADLIDLHITNDTGNAAAFADVIVDGVVLLPQVPVTGLMSLEKNLSEIRQVLSEIPVISTKEAWSFNAQNGEYETEEVETTSSTKMAVPIVLHAPTKEHPAQTQLVSQDVVVGSWHTKQKSGSFSASGKKAILERMDDLIVAVKKAREEANSTQVEPIVAGRKLLEWVLGDAR